MPTNAELSVVLKLRDQVTKELKGIQGKFRRFADTIKHHWVAVGAGAIATGYAIKKLSSSVINAGQELINASSTVEQLQVRLQGLLGSAEEGNKVFEDMTKLAGEVPKTYEEIMQSATDLAGVVRGGSEEIKKLMPIIVDISAGTGLAVRDVTSQMIRMYSAGAAAADMFRERGISAALGFQAGVSYTAEETMKIITEQWEKGAGKFVGASESLADTFEGLTSMMQDAWFQFKVAVGEEIFEHVKRDLKIILQFVGESKKEGGAYNKVVKETGELIGNAYENAKNFVITMIIGGGQAGDAWREVASAVTNIQMSIAGVDVALTKLFSRFSLAAQFGAVRKNAVKEAEAFYEEMKKLAFEARDAADKDYSQMLEDRLNKLREVFNMELEATQENEEEKENIRRESAGETDAIIKDSFLEKETEKLERLKELWDIYREEESARKLAEIQQDTERYQFFIETQKKANESLWTIAGNLRDTFSKGTSKMFVDMIKGNANVKKSFEDLGWKMIEILVDFAVQKAINFALAKTMLAGHVAASTATGAAVAQAWAPAASMTSLASFGANAGPASAGLITTTALAHALALPKAAEGAIVEKPTILLAGEKGREAIIPLDKGPVPARASVTNQFYFNITVSGTNDEIKEMMEDPGFWNTNITRNIEDALKERNDLLLGSIWDK